MLVLSQGPITDWKSNDLDLPIGELFDVIFGDPGVPVSSEDLVAFLRAERLAESVGINTHSLTARFTEESVEQRRSDPGFEHEPSSDVDTNSGSVIVSEGIWPDGLHGSGGNSDSGCSCKG